MKSLLAKASTKIAAALSGAREDIDQLRDRLADLKSEREHVQSLPVDMLTIEQRVDDALAEAARQMPLRFDIGRPEGFTPVDFRTKLSATPGAGATTNFANNGFNILAVLCPDALRAALLKNAPTGGISASERTARVAQLDRDILATEIAEEVACREIEAALGTEIARRSDANPAILLAPDAELR